ncbi:heavy metal translocating P-type ATPase metal-binding domain-containing protein [Novispirillum itersonii]|uniref:heavy metal translocating P-type ATPase metal-binding domain-containing protein n=1 Tax=Novispirillum itersonii TaxID=189 RepID=UPI00036A9A31|nr:heavy metal translocating P-type ATPase metal-binding domain-containing protein [Novispirillum itersonii]
METVSAPSPSVAPSGADLTVCRHCGGPLPAAVPDGQDGFCCHGCKGAWDLINGLGLDSYYQKRCFDPQAKSLRPDDDDGSVTDFASYGHYDTATGVTTLHLMVEGVQCAACIWLIETVLRRVPQVTQARVNMTTRRLTLCWTGTPDQAGEVTAPVSRIGYRLVPYDPSALDQETQRSEKELLRAMAVSGFSAGNIMLFSVSVWSGVDMGSHTRDLFHWISALIAFPTVIYCIRPFARSAWQALRHGRTNMDVPITLGVMIATLMSLWETAMSGAHAYFDAGVTLLFFLLIGRYLDSRSRGRARSAAEHLLSLGGQAVMVLREDGNRVMLPPRQVEPGMTVLVATGERIGVDGIITQGRSDIDSSLISGETTPKAVAVGDKVFAGTLNLSGPLHLRVAAVGEGTLLAEIVRMMEVAEQGRAKFVALADRVARAYAPVVHVLALLTFTGWMVLSTLPWQDALMIAVSVLIITCPCALALAVPVVQVIASGRLLRQGVLLKSATALERVQTVDTVVFDKTGTLTEGQPELVPAAGPFAWTDSGLALAASIALSSRHPLARAVVRRAGLARALTGVEEIPGQGLQVSLDGRTVRLGSAVFCDAPAADPHAGPELWLRDGSRIQRFCFSDPLKVDAAAVVAGLRRRGLSVLLLSGDRKAAVEAAARVAGITDWVAECTPADKTQRLEALKAEGRCVMMVGDGLNDAPALAAADVSVSPSTAVDVTQTAADIVFQGGRLAPVLEALDVARRSDRLVRQNFALALAYNGVTIPLSIAGYVTPLIASVAMSTSSVLVIANALRLARRSR